MHRDNKRWRESIKPQILGWTHLQHHLPSYTGYGKVIPDPMAGSLEPKAIGLGQEKYGHL